ncbi:MAG TPA: hypothetical protein VFJ74_07790, partial [Gemmatimonadaceae bacterium]|nr:hypothetical protein [Gemmatimonadaceae bacterium]
MRVLHVIPSVAARYGGPSVAMRAMATALGHTGVEVTVATTNADGPGKLDVPLGQRVAHAGAEYRYFDRTLPGEWKYSRPLGA